MYMYMYVSHSVSLKNPDKYTISLPLSYVETSLLTVKAIAIDFSQDIWIQFLPIPIYSAHNHQVNLPVTQLCYNTLLIMNLQLLLVAYPAEAHL